MSDWKERYEEAADDEFARHAREPVAALLARVERGDVGEYATLWRALGERATPAEAAWPLYRFLLSDRPYLERYHCAAALLAVLRSTAFEPVALSAAWPSVPRNLERLRVLVEAAAGPPPGESADPTAAG